MLADSLIRKAWVKWPLFIVFWTVIGLSFASQFYLSSSTFGRPVTWQQAVSYALGDWYVWALLSLPIVWLAGRFRFDRLTWWSSGFVHLSASILTSLLYGLVRAALGLWQTPAALGGPIPFLEILQPLLVKTWHFNVLIYWVIVAVTHAFDYYRQFRERELRTLELERGLAEAKLRALQMQLNPHFLFNTLHSISALMHKNVDAADRMLARLGELLRFALDNTNRQEVTLQEELEFLDRYLDIEQTRFGERLQVRREVAADTLQALVPNLVLQPLVENAIQHGIEPQSKPGEIFLSTRRRNGTLEIEVRDNGAGLSARRPLREGVGLSNTRARLQQLYGNAQHLDLVNGADGGLCVRISLPFHDETAESKTAPMP